MNPSGSCVNYADLNSTDRTVARPTVVGRNDRIQQSPSSRVAANPGSQNLNNDNSGCMLVGPNFRVGKKIGCGNFGELRLGMWENVTLEIFNLWLFSVYSALFVKEEFIKSIEIRLDLFFSIIIWPLYVYVYYCKCYYDNKYYFLICFSILHINKIIILVLQFLLDIYDVFDGLWSQG